LTNSIVLVFIQSCLHESNANDLLVTSNDLLIRNRGWFESHIPGLPLAIVTTNEAIEFMDLFAKFRGTYYIASNATVNRGHWYQLSFKSKVSNLQFPGNSVVKRSLLQGFSSRFMDLLRAVDEIGFQYYLGVNNDILDAMVYHLNYFIILVTGIFDSLATLSFIRYNLQVKGVDFNKKKGMTKITLRQKGRGRVVGEDFLRQLRAHNEKLAEFIIHEQCFIELIYVLRDRIIHRERLPKFTLENYDSEGSWKANLVEIPAGAAKNISQFDRMQGYKPLTECGVYKFGACICIEPFHFTKASERRLIEFCNKFFELLEIHPEIKGKLEANRPSGTHRVLMRRQLELFEKCHLGF